MAAGYYVTVVRDRRVGWLLGPYASEPEARAMIPDARRLAGSVDPFSDFDAFGTARLERATLPPGVLNGRLNR